MLESTVCLRSANTGRQRRRLVTLDLRQVSHHVPKRDETILDVVVDLASEVADSGAPLCLPHACGAASQARRQIAKEPREPSHFFRSGVELDVEPIEVEHGGLLRERRQWRADARRDPHAEHQRNDSGSGGSEEEP
jgi:U3 small nucleolar ribonucleoprotein component